MVCIMAVFYLNDNKIQAVPERDYLESKVKKKGWFKYQPNLKKGIGFGGGETNKTFVVPL